MKQKELRLEEGKKLITILSSVCILFVLIISGLRKIHRQELPYDLKREYEFSSGVTTHERTYASTQAIYFPESIRKEGDYVINNDTGYQVCVATPEEGFLFLEQGKYEITGKPLVFFVLQPQGKEKAAYKGEFCILERNEKEVYKYCIAGSERKIKKVKFKTENI